MAQVDPGRLPAFPQARALWPGTWRSSCRESQYPQPSPPRSGGRWLGFSKVDPGGSGGSRAPSASEFQEISLRGSGLKTNKNAKTGLQAFRGLQAVPGASKKGSARTLQALRGLRGLFFRGPKGLQDSSAPASPPGAPFSLAEPSAYTNEKMLLLTKMD